jgi:hypothetical protein
LARAGVSFQSGGGVLDRKRVSKIDDIEGNGEIFYVVFTVVLDFF